MWLRKLLFPFSAIYYSVTYLRNVLFDLNIIKSSSYNFPVICVGNLNVGGTGKSPMTEYVVKLLKVRHKVAVLSRGYGRNTKGYILLSDSCNSIAVGDEPLQFYSKFNDVAVAVCEDRREGIANLVAEVQPEIILLDDAFQHRKVSPGYSILLTAYGDLFVDDFLLPAGNLREPRLGYKRANAIVVTKCPSEISRKHKKEIIERLSPKEHQQVYFSRIVYADYVLNALKQRLNLIDQKSHFTLVTGIANPKPLVEFLLAQGLDFEHLNFSDHHNFSEIEITDLAKKFRVITTEKDFMRLRSHLRAEALYYLPITIVLDDPAGFERQMFETILN